MAFTPVNSVRDAKTARKRLQAFYTPLPLVEKLVEWADVSPSMTCLEPSAGDGRIVHALRATGATVDACEIDTSLHANLAAAGARRVGGDLFDFDFYGYDRIVMNPPFSGRTWIKHVQHAWRRLDDNRGTLIAVVPRAAMELIATCRLVLPGCNHATIEELDPGLFQEYDTNVAVSVIELARCPDVETLGFRNGPTANAVLTIQNDRPLYEGWRRNPDATIPRALREIATSGGSTYGIDWPQVRDHLIDG